MPELLLQQVLQLIVRSRRFGRAHAHRRRTESRAWTWRSFSRHPAPPAGEGGGRRGHRLAEAGPGRRRRRRRHGTLVDAVSVPRVRAPRGGTTRSADAPGGRRRRPDRRGGLRRGAKDSLTVGALARRPAKRRLAARLRRTSWAPGDGARREGGNGRVARAMHGPVGSRPPAVSVSGGHATPTVKVAPARRERSRPARVVLATSRAAAAAACSTATSVDANRRRPPDGRRRGRQRLIVLRCLCLRLRLCRLRGEHPTRRHALGHGRGVDPWVGHRLGHVGLRLAQCRHPGQRRLQRGDVALLSERRDGVVDGVVEGKILVLVLPLADEDGAEPNLGDKLLGVVELADLGLERRQPVGMQSAAQLLEHDPPLLVRPRFRGARLTRGAVASVARRASRTFTLSGGLRGRLLRLVLLLRRGLGLLPLLGLLLHLGNVPRERRDGGSESLLDGHAAAGVLGLGNHRARVHDDVHRPPSALELGLLEVGQRHAGGRGHRCDLPHEHFAVRPRPLIVSGGRGVAARGSVGRRRGGCRRRRSVGRGTRRLGGRRGRWRRGRGLHRGGSLSFRLRGHGGRRRRGRWRGDGRGKRSSQQLPSGLPQRADAGLGSVGVTKAAGRLVADADLHRPRAVGVERGGHQPNAVLRPFALAFGPAVRHRLEGGRLLIGRGKEYFPAHLVAGRLCRGSGHLGTALENVVDGDRQCGLASRAAPHVAPFANHLVAKSDLHRPAVQLGLVALGPEHRRRTGVLWVIDAATRPELTHELLLALGHVLGLDDGDAVQRAALGQPGPAAVERAPIAGLVDGRDALDRVLQRNLAGHLPHLVLPTAQDAIARNNLHVERILALQLGVVSEQRGGVNRSGLADGLESPHVRV
mmetsp:Transcript_7747/g.19934  ORF Transcript_7747/g.19934 Transcript_7747/m.19934 type:complete len:869 (-) Transcript_7747:639-3245(-)